MDRIDDHDANTSQKESAAQTESPLTRCRSNPSIKPNCHFAESLGATSIKRILDFISPERATRLAFLLFLAASPAYYLCRSRHFCMQGHLQHPQDTSTLAVLADGFWLLCFTCSIALAFRADIVFRYSVLFVIGVAFLFIIRPGSMVEILQIPVQIALCLFSVAGLLGWLE